MASSWNESDDLITAIADICFKCIAKSSDSSGKLMDCAIIDIILNYRGRKVWLPSLHPVQFNLPSDISVYRTYYNPKIISVDEDIPLTEFESCPLCNGNYFEENITLQGRDFLEGAMYGAAEQYFDFCGNCPKFEKFMIASYHA